MPSLTTSTHLSISSSSVLVRHPHCTDFLSSLNHRTLVEYRNMKHQVQRLLFAFTSTVYRCDLYNIDVTLSLQHLRLGEMLRIASALFLYPNRFINYPEPRYITKFRGNHPLFLCTCRSWLTLGYTKKCSEPRTTCYCVVLPFPHGWGWSASLIGFHLPPLTRHGDL